MSALLRPSSRHVARLALHSLPTASRPGARAAGARTPRIAHVPPSLSAYLLPRPRCYSTGPGPAPKGGARAADAEKKRQGKDAVEGGGGGGQATPDDGPVEAAEATGADEPPKLPEGWVHLSADEFVELHKMTKLAPPSQQEILSEALTRIRKGGVPVALQTLLRKQQIEGLSISESMQVMRLTHKVAVELASEELERLVRKRENMRQRRERIKENIEKQRMFNPNEPELGGKEEANKAGQEGSENGKQKTRSNSSKNQQGKRNAPNYKAWDPTGFITWMVAAAVAYPMWSVIFLSESRYISWQELRKDYLDKGLVEKLVVSGGTVRVDLNHEATRAMYPDNVAANPDFHLYVTIGSIETFERHLDEAQDELEIPAAERIPVTYAGESPLGTLIMAFGPPLLVLGVLVYMARRGSGGGGSGGMFGFGKSKAKMYNHETAVQVKFADIAGMDEAKTEIMEFVAFLQQPERFQRLGAKIPRGAILSGPPGTGKTLLAKATAGESGVPFFSVSGSEFVEMFVGVGASRVRDLFAQARKNSPCIVFIDEIDAIGRSRSDGNQRFGGNEEREATLNQILTEMDGFNTAEQIVVLAGTNRPDVLDKALMRPGRFDRQIHIDRPTIKGRVDIFKVYLAKVVTKEDLEYLSGRLAALTPGFSGADIANAVNEAALVAARTNEQSIDMSHFEKAIERVVGGLERKSLVLNPEERRTVAYHEAGHAICGWYFEFADPLLKVSIIPRGKGALGYAQYLPAGDAYLMTVRQLMDRMAMTLGGRISEELHFPTVTTGASDDFRKVTMTATNMVTQWGMSDALGPVMYDQDKNQFNKPFAEDTAQKIDAEVRRIVDAAYQQCKDLLVAKKAEVGIVAEELLRKEMLTRDDMVRLLGPRPFAEREEFTKYFDNSQTSAPPPPPSEGGGEPEAPVPAFKDLR